MTNANPARPAAATAKTTKAAPAVAARPARPAAPAAPKATAKAADKGPGGGKRKRLKLPAPGRRIGSENLLWGAVSVSLVVHAILLAAHFKYSDILPTRQVDKGLEVVLVNSRHAHAPKDAQVLAQTNLDGGGNSSTKARPSTPLPPQQQNQEGESLVEMQQRVEQLEARQRELLRRSDAIAKAQVETPSPDEAEAAERVRGKDLIESTRAIAQLEAEIRKQQQAYAERPRKAFIGSRAKEYRFAQYVEDWRQKIERVGTLNFPKGAQGNKLYGSLMITVEVKHDGSVLSAEVKRSSGSKELDAHAMRVLQLAAPFAAFSPQIRKDTDVIVISRTWKFAKSDTLDATHD